MYFKFFTFGTVQLQSIVYRPLLYVIYAFLHGGMGMFLGYFGNCRIINIFLVVNDRWSEVIDHPDEQAGAEFDILWDH